MNSDNKPKHTPGPWKVIKPMHGHETKYQCVQIGKDKSYTTLDLKPEDARLIAASPELLEACKEFVAKCDRGEARSVRSYAAMKAAIAKAERSAE